MTDTLATVIVGPGRGSTPQQPTVGRRSPIWVREPSRTACSHCRANPRWAARTSDMPATARKGRMPPGATLDDAEYY
jgi:hypothetical protein